MIIERFLPQLEKFVTQQNGKSAEGQGGHVRSLVPVSAPDVFRIQRVWTAERKRREAIIVRCRGAAEVDRGITYSLAHYLYPRDTRSALILFH